MRKIHASPLTRGVPVKDALLTCEIDRKRVKESREMSKEIIKTLSPDVKSAGGVSGKRSERSRVVQTDLGTSR